MPKARQAKNASPAERGRVLGGVLIGAMLGAAGFFVLQLNHAPPNNALREDKPEQEAAAAPVSAPPRDVKFKGKSLGEWVAGLKDKDPNVRRQCATNLIGIDSAQNSTPAAGVADLVVEAETLKDADADVRLLAAYVLGNIKAPTDTLVPALAMALRDQDQRVRRAAATAIVNAGRRNPKSLAPLLRDALADKDPDVRRLAQFIQEQMKPADVAVAPAPPGEKEAQPKEPPDTSEDKRVGKAAPEIRGEDLDGIRFKLSDYRGKVVVLTFWAEY